MYLWIMISNILPRNLSLTAFIIILILGVNTLSAQDPDMMMLESKRMQSPVQSGISPIYQSKPYQRFLNEQLIANTRHTTNLFNQLKTFNQKKQIILRNSQNTWSPIGPSFAPLSNDPTLIPGTGRINTIAFHPTNQNILWLGGGQGGIWKTTNGAKTWFPIGDNLPVLRISDIAVNPHNPEEIYVCLGDYAYVGFGLELNDRKRNTHYGIGIYKTDDGGENWSPTGLQFGQGEKDETLMRRLFFHPQNDSILLTAGISGIYQSQDKGDNWQKIQKSLIWDIEQDPVNPEILYATTGFIKTIPVYKSSLIKSDDFGMTWREIVVPGIPEKNIVQRIEIAISKVNPQIVFLVACDIEGGLHGFYKSSDRGETWALMADSPNILHWYDGKSGGGQGTYDLAILSDPIDTNTVYVSGVNNWISQDAGKSWSGTSFWKSQYGPSVHADHHYLAYNPLDQHFYLCHDGGVSRTSKIKPGSWADAYSVQNYQWPTQWEHLNNGLANFAFYRISVGKQNPNRMLSGAQDMGSFYQNGTSWSYLDIGDGMECIVHPTKSDIIFTSTQYGRLSKSIDGGKNFKPLGGSRPWVGENAEWTTPYMLLPEDPDKLYVGAGNVWYSKNGGDDFIKISDFANLQSISALAISTLDPNYIYVAKRIWHSTHVPGQVLMTDDHGTHWKDITSGLPDSLYYTYLDIDDDDPQHAYLTMAGFIAGQKVFETLDGGENWQNISLNLPNLPANCVRHQPESVNNLVYVAMDRGIYFKDDLMTDWQLYAEGFPNVIVTELEIHLPSEKLFASTFGRGIWMNNLITENTSNTELQQFDLSWNIYPNPAMDIININIGKNSNLPSKFELVDIMGRICYTHQDLLQAPGTYQISVSLPDGMYYARLWQGNHLSARQVQLLGNK